ncbi:hypothetical protein DPMN_050541 [Dreissena polymorpha]|uniref:Uncharacterized protein n=1 Tax=Dreissena polymorpha TaxID=45954 RepID=A0A9D4CHQ8_DREPO|nr:hypothetical protein DPMN_050541 [Dreissena polymorpha]
MAQCISQLPKCSVLTGTVYRAKTTTVKRLNTFHALMAAIGTCHMGAKKKNVEDLMTSTTEKLRVDLGRLRAL